MKTINTKMQKIKIVIAEDIKMFRDMIAKELATDCIEVIATVANGNELFEMRSEQEPDILLLDMNMPKMDGRAVLKKLSNENRQIKTIVLSQYDSPVYVADVIIHGARAYLTKDTEVEEVVKAIESVYKDGYYFNDIISQKIMDKLKSDKQKFYYLIEDQRFSEREIEVLRELVEDKTPSQIADSLNISTNTVLFHKRNLMDKTGSESIVSLVKYAIRHKIV